MEIRYFMRKESMNPDEIELRNTSQQFEYEKLSRDIDTCNDVATLKQMCKFLAAYSQEL